MTNKTVPKQSLKHHEYLSGSQLKEATDYIVDTGVTNNVLENVI